MTVVPNLNLDGGILVSVMDTHNVLDFVMGFHVFGILFKNLVMS